MAAAELAALRQGEPRGGMEGPAEAVPERVTERNVRQYVVSPDFFAKTWI